MTTYGFDEDRRTLVACWRLGDGGSASDVAHLPENVSADDANKLADRLTGLSEALWEVYVEPPAAEAEDEQEEFRRSVAEEALDAVTQILRKPNLPDRGMMLVSYVRVEESAHRVGRVLHEVDDQTLADAVVAEVEREVQAVQGARRGDLSGRARQAVLLTRVDSNPVQVVVADGILAADPLEPRALFAEIEPAAACVAAAHWLAAAATVTARVAGVEAADVFMHSDNIEATAVDTPMTVVDAIEAGASPREAVIPLLEEAVMVAAGELPDLDGLFERVFAALEEAGRAPGEMHEQMLEAYLPSRACLLDPRRPARDMLEDLVEGVAASLRLFHEHMQVGDDGVPRLDGAVVPAAGDHAWEPFDDEDEEAYEHVEQAVAEEFVRRVRDEAKATADRLS